MELLIQNQLQQFVPIQTFRTTWGLPDDFAVARFEPEYRQGLGTLDGAGPVLGQVKQAVVQAVPATIPLASLFSSVNQLADHFQSHLRAANRKIGLHEPEIDFAGAGFENILYGAIDEFVRLYQQHQPTPEMICKQFQYDVVYRRWLNAGVRVGTSAKQYEHDNVIFEIFIVYDPYGRVGLEVHTGDQVHYVLDATLACPAASYMKGLCQAVAEAMCAAFVRGLATGG